MAARLREIAAAPAPLDLQILPFAPSELRQALAKFGDTRDRGGITFSGAHQHAEAPGALALLRARRGQQQDRACPEIKKFAPPHTPPRIIGRTTGLSQTGCRR